MGELASPSYARAREAAFYISSRARVGRSGVPHLEHVPLVNSEAEIRTPFCHAPKKEEELHAFADR